MLWMYQISLNANMLIFSKYNVSHVQYAKLMRMSLDLQTVDEKSKYWTNSYLSTARQRSVQSIGGLWVSDDNVLWHHNYSVTEGSWSHYLYNYRCTTAPPSDSYPSQRQRRRFPSLDQSALHSLETVLMRECDGRVNSFTVTLKNDQIYGTHCCALGLDWSLGRH